MKSYSDRGYTTFFILIFAIAVIVIAIFTKFESFKFYSRELDMNVKIYEKIDEQGTAFNGRIKLPFHEYKFQVYVEGELYAVDVPADVFQSKKKGDIIPCKVYFSEEIGGIRKIVLDSGQETVQKIQDTAE